MRLALPGADFVLISIEVGDRFALWDMDWKIPQQYGISQVYGENGGPGGLFHSLRIIPPILEICQKIVDIAPDATVFNYSNPMSRICTTVHRKFPNLNFIGMCHEIASLERHLAPLGTLMKLKYGWTLFCPISKTCALGQTVGFFAIVWTALDICHYL